DLRAAPGAPRPKHSGAPPLRRSRPTGGIPEWSLRTPVRPGPQFGIAAASHEVHDDDGGDDDDEQHEGSPPQDVLDRLVRRTGDVADADVQDPPYDPARRVPLEERAIGEPGVAGDGRHQRAQHGHEATEEHGAPALDAQVLT